MPAPMLLTEPKYPSFDPTLLPWYEAPKAVQDIINMGLENADKIGSEYKMPFVAIRVNSSNVDVYVGINVVLGSSSTFTVRPISPASNFPSISSICYYAQFSHKYAVKSDWRQVDTVAWGDSLAYCSQTFISTDYNIDVYVYGGNGPGKNTAGEIPFVGSLNFSGRNCYVNNKVGFADGRILYGYAAGEFPNVYITTFNPPSLEESQEKTQKGIWESIKALPSQIASSIKGFFTSLGDRISGFFTQLVDDIKGLFIPEDGFFQEHIDEYEGFFSDCLGILYELPDAFITIIWDFISFEPSTDNYGIDIPEVVLPVKTEDGSTEDLVIFEAQFYEFDFLNEGGFATLYEFYRGFVWVIILFSLIAFSIKKFNEFTGG